MTNIDQVLAAVEAVGICAECNNEQGGCEPDARGYECEACGEHTVFGAEELLFML